MDREARVAEVWRALGTAGFPVDLSWFTEDARMAMQLEGAGAAFVPHKPTPAEQIAAMRESGVQVQLTLSETRLTPSGDVLAIGMAGLNTPEGGGAAWTMAALYRFRGDLIAEIRGFTDVTAAFAAAGLPAPERG